mmetsp:Transcript_31366/g.50646  ORF Transcript_31366/g.50646 Transcript_31366/m.50646 type:complete len:109 (+) Transcript_31366:582-908(+)
MRIYSHVRRALYNNNSKLSSLNESHDFTVYIDGPFLDVSHSCFHTTNEPSLAVLYSMFLKYVILIMGPACTRPIPRGLSVCSHKICIPSQAAMLHDPTNTHPDPTTTA